MNTLSERRRQGKIETGNISRAGEKRKRDFTYSLHLIAFLFSIMMQDCGYVFTKGPKAWAALPSDWSCPPCGAPKRRFKKVPKGSASGKVDVKKSWF